MKVLLLSMPDSFEHMYSGAIRMPNGALSSLAGNVDPHHEVAVADLIPGLHKRAQLRDTLEQVGLIALGVLTVGLMGFWMAE